MTTTTTTTPPSPTTLYITAKVHASQHRVEIEASDRCGCFFCFRTFTAATIKTWVDKNQTALCPHCGIDAVIGSGHRPITDQFLRGMHKQYFSYRSK